MVILKMTNKDEGFYSYMGKFFGSRIVQTETKDRIYDDNTKIWYIFLDTNNKVSAFLSVCDNIIKNVYSTNDNSLKQLILKLKKDIIIEPSIVTKIYENVYSDCKLTITPLENYKHFIMIRGDK